MDGLAEPGGTVDKLARAERLLVCVDFDGTICPLGTDAYNVTPHPDAIAALEELADLPDTSVAVLSGRHLDGLRYVCPLGPPAILVGSHGAEPTEGGPELTRDDRAFLDQIASQLNDIVAGNHPAFVETKPYQRVLHVAKLAAADPERAAALMEQAMQLDTGGRPVTPGHNVVEFSAVDTTKGSWLAAEKESYTATLFAGDDVTDETALRVLDPAAGDVGIKVSTRADVETAAQYRLESVDAMAAYLVNLAAARRSARG